MDHLLTVDVLVSLLTLTVLEIILGIDNIIFISILSGKLPPDQRNKGRIIGLSLALITRILLLLSITWIMGLTEPLFSVFGYSFSGRDLILLAGGVFLIIKSVHEIHIKFEEAEKTGTEEPKKKVIFYSVIFQILLLDIVFSLDSVITAVGMASNIEVMITAVIIATLIMLAASKSISDFVDRHASIKVLALSFLILIGVTLVADGLGHHVPKGYIYFSIAFALGVESINIGLAAKKKQKQGEAK